MDERKRKKEIAVAKLEGKKEEELGIPGTIASIRQKDAGETINKGIKKDRNKDMYRQLLASTKIIDSDRMARVLFMILMSSMRSVETKVSAIRMDGVEQKASEVMLDYVDLFKVIGVPRFVGSSQSVDSSFKEELWKIERRDIALASIFSKVIMISRHIDVRPVLVRRLNILEKETRLFSPRIGSEEPFSIIKYFSNIHILRKLKPLFLFENFSGKYITHLFVEVSLMDPIIRFASSVTKTDEVSDEPLLEAVLGRTELCDSSRNLQECEKLGGRFIPRRFSQLSRSIPIIVLRDYFPRYISNKFAKIDPRHTIFSWTHLVGYLLLRVLREVAGGSAEIDYWGPMSGEDSAETRSDYELDVINAIAQRNLQWENYKRKVHVFVLSHQEEEKESKIAGKFLELFRNNLATLYSKGPGFVVIVVSNEKTLRELCKKLHKEVYEEPPDRLFGASMPNLSPVICLDPIKEWNVNDKPLVLKVSELILLGRCNTKQLRESDILPYTMRDLYTLVYNDLVNKLDLILSPFVKRQNNQERYDSHQYELKLLVLRAIIDRLLGSELDSLTNLKGLYEKIADLFKDKRIGVEKIPWPVAQTNVIPDIAFRTNDDKKVCIEIETLIGSEEPMKKIDETIEKYIQNKTLCDEIWIVLEPVTALIHYEELKIRKDYSDAIFDRSLGIQEYLSHRLKFKVIAVKVIPNKSIGSKELEVRGVVLRDMDDFIGEVRNCMGNTRSGEEK